MGRLATMIVLYIDTRTGTGVYGVAGHNAPIFYGDNSKTPFKPSTILGLQEEPSIEVFDVKFEGRDGIFLYTDGLIENSGPSGKVLKMRHLKKMLGEVETLGEIKASILSEGAKIWQETEPEDDVTFCIVRRRQGFA